MSNKIDKIRDWVNNIFTKRNEEGKEITPEESEIVDNLLDLIECTEEGYVLVEGPKSQKYMEEDWFDDEAVLHLNLSAAYFIPIKRIMK